MTTINDHSDEFVKTDEEREERMALGRIVHAFRDYAISAHREVDRWEINYSRLPMNHQRILSSLKEKIGHARRWEGMSDERRP